MEKETEDQKPKDLAGMGLFFPQKQYSSAIEATLTLMHNRKVMQNSMSEAKEKQINAYQKSLG